MDIPYPLLKAWHEFFSKERKKIDDPSPSTSETVEESQIYTYTDLLEFSIFGNSFGISEDLITRKQIFSKTQLFEVKKMLGKFACSVPVPVPVPVGKRDVSLLWYQNISGSFYRIELTRGQWLESQDSLVPVVLRPAKNKPGIHRLMTSPRQIHKAVMEK